MESISRLRTAVVLLLGLWLPGLWGQAQSIAFQPPVLVNASVSATGQLIIKASSSSSAHDFDFLAGKWRMHNKRLKSRLTHCTDWVDYESTDENFGSVLNGIGNLDVFKTDFNAVSNTPYQGLTLRLFNSKTKLWSLYWVDSNTGVLDPPVVGSFEGPIGRFYGKDTLRGRPILFMFTWDKTDPDNPVWSQAFSGDHGRSWETNMTNVSHRQK